MKTQNPFSKVKLYEPKRDYRSEITIWSADEIKSFNELCDMAERFWQIGKVEIADEIMTHITDWENSRATKLKKSLKANFEILADEIEQEQIYNYIDNDCIFTNPKADLLDRLDKIQTVWSNVKYKDIVKHDDCYFFRDNVLDKWTIRTTQRYGKSNLEKDPFKNQKEIPARYKKRMEWKKELIKREPIYREYSSSERLELWNKQQVNENIDQLIENTKNKKLPAPLKSEILSDDEIKSERWTDEKRVEFYSNMYKRENNYNRQDAYEAYGREI